MNRPMDELDSIQERLLVRGLSTEEKTELMERKELLMPVVEQAEDDFEALQDEVQELKEKIDVELAEIARQQELAVHLFQKAASQGHGDAFFMTALCYEKGRGVPLNPKGAFRYYRDGAEAGHAGCQYNYGVALRKGKGCEPDLQASVNWMKKAAQQNHAEAVYTCGIDAYNGRGIKQDYQIAYMLFEQGGGLEHAGAMYHWGLCLEKGRGCQKKMRGPNGAIDKYEKAAELGWPAAMHQVAINSVDLTKAFRMFSAAADMGHAEAAYNAAVWCYKGKGWAIPRDHPLAFARFEQAAGEGHAGAAYFLGVIYQSGELDMPGFEQDLVEAVAWFRRCLEKGPPPKVACKASHKLATCLWKGLGVQQDVELAARLMKKASDQGCITALPDLSAMYWRGEGVTMDKMKSVTFLKRSAELNDPRGCYDLGMLYLEGQPDVKILKDTSTAVLWLNRAASKGHIGAQTELKKVSEASGSMF